MDTTVKKSRHFWCASLFVIMCVVSMILFSASTSHDLDSPIIREPTPLEKLNLKIFVYDLPSRFNFDVLKDIRTNKARFSGYLDQFAEHVIHKQILKSPLITSNPDEADLFYVPVYGAAVVSQQAHNPEKRDAARQRILDAQKYISNKFGYWKKFNGADHVWTFTHDHGPCMDINAERAMEAPTTRLLMHALKDSIFLTNTGDLESPCYNPLKGIVIPPFISLKQIESQNPKSDLGKDAKRDIFASFRGQTTLLKKKDPWFRYMMLYGSPKDSAHNHGKGPSAEPCFDWTKSINTCQTCQSQCCAAEMADQRVYSNGVRQRLLSLFSSPHGKGKKSKVLKRDDGFLVTREKSSDWFVEMKRSIFCLSPLGFAKWTIRNFESVLAGCIPVIIADNLDLPAKSYVRWSTFSVVVREKDVSRLSFILKAIPEAKINTMQKNLELVRNHFTYGGGGLAFLIIANELAELSSRRKDEIRRIKDGSLSWREWIPIGNRRRFPTPYPMSVNPGVSEGNRDICLAVQLSSDRADLLSRILFRWKGPVSAAVLIKNSKKETLQENGMIEAFSDRLDASRSEKLKFSFLRYTGSHPSQRFQHYPVNKLRNMAIRGCTSKYVVTLDVDFLPSKNAYENIQRHLHLLDGVGRNALVLPAFEVDADVLNKGIHAVDSVLTKPFLRDLYMVDARNEWRNTPKTLSKARPFQLMHYKDGHYATDNEKWMTAEAPYTVAYKWGYEPYLVLKRPFPLFDERFIGYGQNKVSYSYELAAAKFTFIVLPDVFVVHVHADSSIGVRVVSSSKNFSINQNAINTLKKKKDFTAGWSCWRSFCDRVEQMYGFRAREPCWVSVYIWNDVNNRRGDVCVVNK